MNQESTILKHLIRHGKITSWEAITKHRITRVAEMIRRLRFKGHKIDSYWKTNPRTKQRFVEYILQ